MKKGKKAAKAVMVIVVLLVLAGVGVYLFGEQAVEMGIEKGASQSLGVAVTLGEVDLRPFSGRARLEELAVANPEGYQHEQLLELGSGEVHMDVGSLLSDTVGIRSVVLDGMTLVLEQKGLTNNLQEVLGNIERRPEEAEDRPGKEVHVDELEITNTVVIVRLLPVPGREADRLTLKLAPIRLEGLGTDRPMNTADLAGRVLLAIAAGIAEQGAGVLPAGMVEGLKEQVSAFGEVGRQLLEKAGKTLEAVIEGRPEELGERVEELREGVEGLRDLLPGGTEKPKD